MLKTLPVPADAYHQIYEGKDILIDADPKSADIMRHLQEVVDLTQFNINFTLHQGSGRITIEDLIRTTNADGAGFKELIFLGDDAGLKKTGNDGNTTIISALSRSGIEKILEDSTSARITNLTEAMRGKLARISLLLLKVGKIVLTNNLRGEIENWMGDGTLLFNEDQLEFSGLRQIEQPIHDAMSQHYIEQGVFKERDGGEGMALRINDSPIGEVTFFPHRNADGSQYIEIGRLWAPDDSNGVGYYILLHALSTLQQRGLRAEQIFAVTKETNRGATNRFKSMGFEEFSLRQLQTSVDPALPDYLGDYTLEDGDDRLVYRLKYFPSVPTLLP